ncbi:unnamed protein product [Closterium sp. NIES-65]|nr:unnamed protein product [Closterium sp. NIES-65]
MRSQHGRDIRQPRSCAAPSEARPERNRTGCPSPDPPTSPTGEETPTNHRSTTPRRLQDQVRREEAEENGNEEEGIERQGRGRVESEDVAAEEDHQGNLQTGWAAHRQEAQEVPQPQPVGREEVEEPMASTAPTQQARTIAAGTTGEMLTDNAAALAPRGGDCASDTGARKSLAGQREGAEADGDVGRSRHEPGDVDGSARGESDRLARDDGGRSRPPRARPGQRRLGAGLAPARPGPVSGWDQQENQPSGPTERRIDACQSSPRGLQAQGGEGEENRVAEHLEENEYREEEGIATGLVGLGLRCNLTKSSAWSPTGNTTDLPEGLAAAVDGVQVLGSPIGAVALCRRTLRALLERIALPLSLVSKLHPQHAMLLLSRCISRRISYLLRTTPADILPIREWRGWSERLLWTALRAAHINVPSKELEQSLVWRQATLPIALGGVGLIDPLSEAPAAYLASLRAAQMLLQQMPPSPNHQLSQVASLVSPLGEGVAGREGEAIRDLRNRLPEEARELLGEPGPGTEEPSPGADKEQTAEVVLSASPAPVTAAVLAAAMSAATGEQGRAPLAEDVMTAAACAETPVDAVAANRQECA